MAYYTLLARSSGSNKYLVLLNSDLTTKRFCSLKEIESERCL